MAKKASTTAMTNWQEELKKQAQEATQTEAHVGAGGAFISTRGGQFSFKGGTTSDGKLSVVVLDHILENVHYDGEYDSDNPQSPACFAFGRKDDDMAPHEAVEEPINDICKTCDYNKFGSAEKGKGKACKNIRRLAVVFADQLDNPEAEVAFIKLPVMSVKHWASYVRKLADSYELPPMGVITEMSLKPDPKAQWVVNFRALETIEDGDVMGRLMERKTACQSELFAPYSPRRDVEDDDPAPSGKATRGKATSKATSKAKAARGARGR